MSRFENSLALAKSSWEVLRDDKQLTLLPLFSLIATVALAAAVLLPISVVARDGSGNYDASRPLVWILGFAGAVALSYVVVFFNAALVYAANSRFRGETMSIGDAMRAAHERAHVLLPWAVVSATVSIVLRGVESRGGIAGQIVARIAGLAWSVVTFLVLPVLVFEGIGPFAAVKRSGQLFKQTWGENLIAKAGIGLLGMFAMLAGAVPLVPFLLVGGAVAVIGVVAFVIWCIAVMLVVSALTGIFQTALYRFATGAPVPGFDDVQLRNTFEPRRRGNGFFGNN